MELALIMLIVPFTIGLYWYYYSRLYKEQKPKKIYRSKLFRSDKNYKDIWGIWETLYDNTLDGEPRIKRKTAIIIAVIIISIIIFFNLIYYLNNNTKWLEFFK